MPKHAQTSARCTERRQQTRILHTCTRVVLFRERLLKPSTTEIESHAAACVRTRCAFRCIQLARTSALALKRRLGVVVVLTHSHYCHPTVWCDSGGHDTRVSK